jgi:hypothetical protein
VGSIVIVPKQSEAAIAPIKRKSAAV